MAVRSSNVPCRRMVKVELMIFRVETPALVPRAPASALSTALAPEGHQADLAKGVPKRLNGAPTSRLSVGHEVDGVSTIEEIWTNWRTDARQLSLLFRLLNDIKACARGMSWTACLYSLVADVSRARRADGRLACVSAQTPTVQGTDARMFRRLAIRYARGHRLQFAHHSDGGIPARCRALSSRIQDKSDRMNTPDQREPPAIQRTTYDQWRCTLYAVQHPSGLRS